MIFLYQIRLKKDQKVHVIDQKRAEHVYKREKIEFLDLKYLLFSGIFLNGIERHPPPPLTENHSGRKLLLEYGVEKRWK